MGLHEEAFPLFIRAIRLFKSENRKTAQATALRNLAISLRLSQEYDSALLLLNESIQLFEEAGSVTNGLIAQRELATNYILLDQPEQASAVLIHADSIANANALTMEITRIARVSGDLLAYQAQYDSALHQYTIALSGYTSDRLGKQAVLNSIGSVYLQSGRLEEAIAFYRDGLKLSKELNQPISAGIAYNGIAVVQRRRGLLDSAIYNYEQSIELLESRDPVKVLEPLFNLSLLYGAIGEFEKGLQLSNQYGSWLEVIQLNKNKAVVLQLQLSAVASELKVAEVNREKEALKSKNLLTTLTLLTVLFFLLVILVYSYYRSRLMKARSKVQMQQAKIKGEQDTQARIAQDLHDELGNMLKMVKFHFKAAHKVLLDKQEQQQEHFDQALDLLSKALDYARNLAKDLLPATLKSFGLMPALKEIQNSLDGLNGLRVVLNPVNMQDRLPEWVERNLYYIIRELAGNVINHAQASLLTIQVIRHKDQISIAVEDDGIGFEPEAAANQEGMGMKNLADRVKAIDGTFTIDSRTQTNTQAKSGTVVLIDIPLNQLNTKPNDSHE